MATPNPNQPAAYLDDGFGPAREYLAAMRELDARLRELTESARNWTPARPDGEHASRPADRSYPAPTGRGCLRPTMRSWR